MPISTEELFRQERRRRLAAEQMLEHLRGQLLASQRSLGNHVERVSIDYVREKAERRRLSAAAKRVGAERQAADSRAARAGRRLLHAVNAIRDGFAVWDSDGLLLQANPTFRAIFDGAIDIVPGIPYLALMQAAAEEGLFDLTDLDPDQWLQEVDQRYQNDLSEPLSLRLYDGRVIRMLDRRTEDDDVVSLALDVTTDTLREEALDLARAEAEQANHAKSRFLARMSHEFRTPMNGIIGMSDLLLEGRLDEDERLYVQTIRDSGTSLLNIVNDVLDAARLDSGQMTLRPMPFDLEQVLMQAVRLATASGGAAAGVALDYPIGAPTRFIGDEARIRQVVTNLLGNAVKFAADGDVTLSVTVTKRGGGEAAGIGIEVWDTGPGIPPERRDAVFGTFTRLDPGKAEGAGLGLSIARDLARLMGGDLVLLDPETEEEGARFSFTTSLPLSRAWPEAPRLPPTVRIAGGECLAQRTLRRRFRAAGVEVLPEWDAGSASVPTLVPVSDNSDALAALAQSPPLGDLFLLGPRKQAPAGLLTQATAVLPDPCDGRTLLAALSGKRSTLVPSADPTPDTSLPLRILAADDVATNRLLISRMLKAGDREIELVEDGDVAVERFEASPFDVVLLDISMPRMDGREAARRIRAMPSGAAVPIVAMTAHADPAEVEDIRNAGIDEVLVKPVRKPELTKLLARLEPRLTPPGAQLSKGA